MVWRVDNSHYIASLIAMIPYIKARAKNIADSQRIAVTQPAIKYSVVSICALP
jgi:hypothetical protein